MIRRAFARAASATARLSGSLNDTWQLVINTGTTIVTFLMVFLIQHTQNADTAALHVKLDELIRVSRDANQELLNLEAMEPTHLEDIRQRYEALVRTAADIKTKKERCMPCAAPGHVAEN